MKNVARRTLSLLPSNEKERNEWREALEPYAWADGEFGLLCTESAFLDFCATADSMSQLSRDLKRAAHQFAAVL